MKLDIANGMAKAAGQWVDARIEELIAADELDESGQAELELLVRIAQFEFERYPDYTAPWHLLSWPHMRWTQVRDIVDIIEMLRQPTGARVGEPIVLEPFQIFILLCFLGPEEPETGLRLIDEVVLTIGRKNAKTTLMAAMIVAFMALSKENGGIIGGEIQVGAADRKQAGIVHTMCERMAFFDQSIGIDEKFHSVPSSKKLVHKQTLTELVCLSSDAYRAHGGNPSMVLLDEIGNVPTTHAEDFYSVLTSGYGAQEEPLTFLLSTQAPNDQHFFSQIVDKVKRINEGAIEDLSVAGFVFSLPETDDAGEKVDPHDPDLWYLANPGIDTIMSRRDMEKWSKKALSMPSLQNKFENLKLNRRVSETAALISRVAWERNAFGFDMESLEGRRCWGGIDLAETTDMASFVLVFELLEEIGGASPVVPYYWIPGNELQERSRRDHIPYDVWAREGLLDASSEMTIDYGLIAKRIAESLDRYDLQAIGFDRWKMKYLRGALAALGLEWQKTDRFLIEIGQGFKDQPRSIDLLEKAILNDKLAHAGNPILKWNAGNTVTISDAAKNRKFEKARSFGRIDGIVALANALHAKDELDIEVDMMESVLNDPNRNVIM